MEDINEQLILAIKFNNYQDVQQLIANGADVNYRNNIGHTPLHYVADLDIAQYLVSNGANVNYRDNEGTSLLHHATSLEIIQCLVENGADVNCQNNDGDTPLHYICLWYCNNFDHTNISNIIKYFVSKGADINLQNKYGNTVLHCSFGNLFICEILLEYGANMHKQNHSRLSTYDMVIRSGNFNMIILFEECNLRHIKEPWDSI